MGMEDMTSNSAGSGELMGDSGDVEMRPSSHELPRHAELEAPCNLRF